MEIILRWITLSAEAKNILGCIFGGCNNRMHEITIVSGKRPLRDGRAIPQWPNEIDSALFDEIKSFAEYDHLPYAVHEVEDGCVSLRIAVSRKKVRNARRRSLCVVDETTEEPNDLFATVYGILAETETGRRGLCSEISARTEVVCSSGSSFSSHTQSGETIQAVDHRHHGEREGDAETELMTQFEYKTYRVEWAAQYGPCDQYGKWEGPPDWEEICPTYDAAKEAMMKVAIFDERLYRWVWKENPLPYRMARITCRETLVETVTK